MGKKNDLEQYVKKHDVQYYQDLIDGKREANTMMDSIIAKSREKPDIVLVCIGLNHPMTETVFKLLAKKVFDEFKNEKFWLSPLSDLLKSRFE